MLKTKCKDCSSPPTPQPHPPPPTRPLVFRYLVMFTKIPVIKTPRYEVAHLAPPATRSSIRSWTNWSCWSPSSSHRGRSADDTCLFINTARQLGRASSRHKLHRPNYSPARHRRHSCDRRLGPTNQVRPHGLPGFRGRRTRGVFGDKWRLDKINPLT